MIITGALHVHEEGVGSLHEPLQLVLPGLSHGGGVQQILNELQDRQTDRQNKKINFSNLTSFLALNERITIRVRQKVAAASGIIPPCLLDLWMY